MVFFLPETRYTALPETLDDVKALRKFKRGENNDRNTAPPQNPDTKDKDPNENDEDLAFLYDRINKDDKERTSVIWKALEVQKIRVPFGA